MMLNANSGVQLDIQGEIAGYGGTNGSPGEESVGQLHADHKHQDESVSGLHTEHSSVWQ